MKSIELKVLVLAYCVICLTSCTTTPRTFVVVDGYSDSLSQESDAVEGALKDESQEIQEEKVNQPQSSSAEVESTSGSELQNQTNSNEEIVQHKAPDIIADTRERLFNPTVEVQSNEQQKESIKQENTLSSKHQEDVFLSSVIDARSSHPMKDKSFIWPVSGAILKHMEQQNDDFKDGITIKAKSGAKVLAVADGVVMLCKHGNEIYGNYVVIKHGKYTITYGNLKSIEVKKGKKTKRGDVIGLVGRSGQAKQPQLFFSVKKNGIAVDPEHR
ncbi:murein hydrolase activator EnvC family protein [Candidatus Fokinia crypta]|uniref:EnvC-superfamily metallopeptidase n=1 Tax=Candidatus Fokinia crypta TaxID=1920990 RepID=A0ABZ0UUG4_9RICK|nr:M23 family metallopeptidase [Candidatus Fokinia cryptica]WPX97715.1 EnvC-superfamily metallopeptidase [Candidatus Fokinia cryptica]